MVQSLPTVARLTSRTCINSARKHFVELFMWYSQCQALAAAHLVVVCGPSAPWPQCRVCARSALLLQFRCKQWPTFLHTACRMCIR